MPETPVTAMLDVRIASKSFTAADGRSRRVLGDIAFSVNGGEVIGLLGPSGIGKTTLLRILLELDAAFQGTVLRRPGRIGAMFQEPRLLPWLTVGDNLRLVMADGMARPNVAELLALVQLRDAEGLFPRQLSLGMARRASLARAMAVAPDLLVLDEPFASLDPQLAGVLAAAITDWVRRTNGAVVLATHDLRQALEFLSRVLILSGEPATLAGDLPVPAHRDPASRAAQHAAIFGAFGFLDPSGSAPDQRPSVLQGALGVPEIKADFKGGTQEGFSAT